VLTGSQLPLALPRSDARQNLLDSVCCATASFSPPHVNLQGALPAGGCCLLALSNACWKCLLQSFRQLFLCKFRLQLLLVQAAFGGAHSALRMLANKPSRRCVQCRGGHLLWRAADARQPGAEGQQQRLPGVAGLLAPMQLFLLC